MISIYQSTGLDNNSFFNYLPLSANISLSHDDADIIEIPTRSDNGVEIHVDIKPHIKNYGGKGILISWMFEIADSSTFKNGVIPVIDALVEAGNDPCNIFLIYNGNSSDYINHGDVYRLTCNKIGKTPYPINSIACSGILLRCFFRGSYLEPTPDITDKNLNKFLFMCAKIFRKHRYYPLYLMYLNDLAKYGKIGVLFPKNKDKWRFFIENRNKLDPYHDEDLNLDLLKSVIETDHIIDRDNSDENGAAFLWPVDVSIYADTFASYVSETDASDNEPFWATEKIYNSILNCHPFIVASTYKFLSNLRKLGYKTFSDYIDESYDLERDFEKRIHKTIKTLEDLINLDEASKLKMIEIAKYNRNVAISKVMTETKMIEDFLDAKNKSI